MILLKELELICDESSILSVDSQDLEAIIEHFPILKGEGITGAVTTAKDGEFTEAWFTTASKPYDLASAYYTAEEFLGHDNASSIQ